MAPRSLRIGPRDVRVWHAPTSDLAGVDERAIAGAWLTADEQARYARFRHDDDRRMFLLGRVLARQLVGAALEVPPDRWQWREGPQGRPEIDAPATDLHFNLAHSAGLVACVLARGREVGVDVEDRQRRAVERALVDRYCSAVEARDVAAAGDAWHDRFLRYWTLKEAYLKARGLGISVPLADITFHLDAGGARVSFDGSIDDRGDRWRFDLAEPTPRHFLAVAVSHNAGDAAPMAMERLSDYLS